MAIKITTKNITHFETPDYDVVKFDVKSKDLVKLNKLLTDSFEFTTDYPDYHPHMTIAYVKKGTGKKYNTNQKEIDMSGKELIYSPSSKGESKKVFTL
jgi:2'-5' RNA ligase